MAMGQAFFSLSITGSDMIVYGTYLSKGEDIPAASVRTAVFDTLAAMLAALAIMPAVFAFGIEPNAGPPLMFITLPNIFRQMPMGRLFAALFFLSVAFAGITSPVSYTHLPWPNIKNVDLKGARRPVVSDGSPSVMSLPASSFFSSACAFGASSSTGTSGRRQISHSVSSSGYSSLHLTHLFFITHPPLYVTLLLHTFSSLSMLHNFSFLRCTSKKPGVRAAHTGPLIVGHSSTILGRCV